MTIGIDASRAFTDHPTGTEHYSQEIIRALLKIDTKNRYVLYVRGDSVILASEARPGSFQDRLWSRFRSSRNKCGRSDNECHSGDERSEDTGIVSNRFSTSENDKRSSQSDTRVTIRPIPWPVLWTQGGLALETWLRPPDVLFIPSHTLPVLRHPRVKTVVTIHDLGAEWLPEYHQFPQKFYLTWATKYALSHADAIIPVSGATKQDIIKRYHTDPNKLYVIHEGVDTNVFKPTSSVIPASEARPESQSAGRVSSWQASSASAARIDSKRFRTSRNDKRSSQDDTRKPYFLFVGTIQPRKNLVRVIESFARACHPERRENVILASDEGARPGSFQDRFRSSRNDRTDRNDRYNLLLVGRRGWMADDIYAAPKRFGVEDRVHFLENVPDKDLPALYSGATALIFPSLWEGFGLPILEAMACGCPVITSNISSMPEVAGDAALLVDPYKTESITQAIQVLATNKSKRQELRKKGIKRAKQYTWERAARRTLDVILV